jgi:hypothetical protein
MSGTFLFLYHLIYSLEFVQIDRHFSLIFQTILSPEIKKTGRITDLFFINVNYIFIKIY